MNGKKRPLVYPVAALLLCAATFSGCVSNGDTRVSWEKDKETIIRSVHDIKVGQQEAENFSRELIATNEQRLLDLEGVNQQQQQQIDALLVQMKALRLASKKASVKHTRRLNKPATKIKPPARKLPVKAAPVASVPVVPVKSKDDVAAEALAEKNAYTAAYLALKSGRFDEASTAFNAQLDQYPQGEYADQAWYWLGETRFAQNDLDKAMHAFKYVADRYLNSAKHAAALLKLGQISEAMANTDKARSYYQRLIKVHPDSALAEQARLRMTEFNNVNPSAPVENR